MNTSQGLFSRPKPPEPPGQDDVVIDLDQLELEALRQRFRTARGLPGERSRTGDEQVIDLDDDELVIDLDALTLDSIEAESRY
jgi:hypothetical protein